VLLDVHIIAVVKEETVDRFTGNERKVASFEGFGRSAGDNWEAGSCEDLGEIFDGGAFGSGDELGIQSDLTEEVNDADGDEGNNYNDGEEVQ